MNGKPWKSPQASSIFKEKPVQVENRNTICLRSTFWGLKLEIQNSKLGYLLYICLLFKKKSAAAGVVVVE